MLDQFTLNRRLKHLENTISKLTTEISKQIKGGNKSNNFINAICIEMNSGIIYKGLIFDTCIYVNML